MIKTGVGLCLISIAAQRKEKLSTVILPLHIRF